MLDVGCEKVARAPRYNVGGACRASVQGGFQSVDESVASGIPFMEARVRDISRSGVALTTMGKERAVAAAQNVLVHIEGIGPATGWVARAFEGGFAIQFREPMESQGSLWQALGAGCTVH